MLNTAVSSPQAIINRYAPISLREMADVALLNRTDTKFVMATSTLLAALRHLDKDYRVLQIEGMRLHQYETLYFDTADFDLYHRHHAGAADRYKVRSRAYVASDLSFLEVKHKTNKKRTIKDRLQTPHMQTRVNRETAVFLHNHYPHEAAELLPVLWNNFSRITLVSVHRAERLTLDFDLSFRWGQRQTVLPGVAIAEVKREGFTQNSDFIRQMRASGVRPTAFSKYCLGVNYLYPQLKQNNFKPRHLLMQKIMKGESHGYYH
jgi:hypothetical protein